MTPVPHLSIVTPPATMEIEPPRQTLRLKPKAPTRGYVDGAWWPRSPRRLVIDGHQIRLGGFNAQNAHTIDVIGRTRPHLTLLVLPPATDPATADKILVTAGQRDNIDSIDRLLAPSAAAEPSPAASDFPDSAVRRWEVDDGPVH